VQRDRFALSGTTLRRLRTRRADRRARRRTHPCHATRLRESHRRAAAGPDQRSTQERSLPNRPGPLVRSGRSLPNRPVRAVPVSGTSSLGPAATFPTSIDVGKVPVPGLDSAGRSRHPQVRGVCVGPRSVAAHACRTGVEPARTGPELSDERTGPVPDPWRLIGGLDHVAFFEPDRLAGLVTVNDCSQSGGPPRRILLRPKLLRQT